MLQTLVDLARKAYGVVTGDLATVAEALGVGDLVNAADHVQTVIHSAGIYIDSSRIATSEADVRTLAVMCWAPYTSPNL
jgi:hypothetical protein